MQVTKKHASVACQYVLAPLLQSCTQCALQQEALELEGTRRERPFLFYFYYIHLQLDFRANPRETDVMNSNGIVRVSFFLFVRSFS